MQSAPMFLDNLLERYGWLSNVVYSPEFTTLMATNAVPTHFQASQLHASIQGLDPFIHEIQAEIDLLRKTAASLESRHLRLTTIRRDYKDALSPIRRLPGEVLAEILRSTRERRRSKGYYISEFDVFNLSEGPWYLGQVCSAWRVAVEIFCPDFW